MIEDVRALWRLLAPHVRPRLPVIALVVALGWLSATGQRLVVVMLEPALRVLFPSADEGPAELVADGVAGGQESAIARALGSVHAVYERFNEWLAGPQGARLDADATMQHVWRIALVLSAIALLTGVMQYFFRLLSRWVALRMVVDLRLRLAEHLMGLSMQYHGRRRFGDLLSRISNDVTSTLAMLNQVTKDLIQEPLAGVMAIVFMFTIAPLPAFVVLVGMPVLAAPVAIFARRVRKNSTKSLKTLGSSVQTLAQMFQGIRTVKAFRAEERELASYRAVNETYVRNTMRMVRAIALSHAWTLTVSHVGMAFLLVLVGFLAVRGFFPDLPRMSVFFMLVAALYTNIKVTTRAWTQVQESVGAADRLHAVLEEPADLVEAPGARDIAGLGSGIRFEDVTFAYPDGEGNALEGLTLHVRPGETLALVGPSGAGKTTVVDLVARFIDPTGGRVTADGQDLRELTLASWNRQFAMVGQEPFLFHASIEDNVRYGRPDATHAEVVAAARMAGIHDFVETLPQGYATDVADAGSRLSGGQRQRITIARAFLKEAPLLLLDEATSALDTESEAVVQEALERLMADRTVIVIAHRLSTVRNADRIAVMEAGRLVELGSHDELLRRRGLYARLWAAQGPRGEMIGV